MENIYVNFLTDSAYGLSNHMITPFKSPATNLPENQVFNKFLAKSRVRNEHTIGILKGRWASLNELRIAINKREDAEHAVGWIMTCCLLHNMLADLGDEWEETARSTVSVDSSQISHSVCPISPQELRNRIKEDILRLNAEREMHPTGD